MRRVLYFTSLLLLLRGAAACDCHSCGCPVPVPVPVTTLVPVPVPGPSSQCPENSTAVWIRDKDSTRNNLKPWEPYMEDPQPSSEFIDKRRGFCGALTQVGGKCDVLCKDDFNKEWSITPYGVLTSSGWGWGEDGAKVGVRNDCSSALTYCAGFVLPLPYDPTTPPPDPPWYNNTECQVVPSMLCCFPDGVPIDPDRVAVDPDATPIWSPPPPPPPPTPVPARAPAPPAPVVPSTRNSRGHSWRSSQGQG